MQISRRTKIILLARNKISPLKIMGTLDRCYDCTFQIYIDFILSNRYSFAVQPLRSKCISSVPISSNNDNNDINIQDQRMFNLYNTDLGF